MKKIKFAHTVLKNTETHETTEYNVFVLDTRNRPINETKVASFMSLFKKGQNFMKEFPAVIDDNFIVLDGQHRFEACKRLGLPFFFRWTDKLTIDNVVEVQVNAGWTPKDYLHSFIVQGNEHYIKLQQFINKYDLPITTAIYLLGETRGFTACGFHTGNFKISKQNEIAGKELADSIMDFYDAGFSGAKQRTFIIALARCKKNPDYKHENMMEKMKMYGASILRGQTSADYYVRNLEQLYNYRKSQKIRFI